MNEKSYALKIELMKNRTENRAHKKSRITRDIILRKSYALKNYNCYIHGLNFSFNIKNFTTIFNSFSFFLHYLKVFIKKKTLFNQYFMSIDSILKLLFLVIYFFRSCEKTYTGGETFSVCFWSSQVDFWVVNKQFFQLFFK